MINSNVIYIYVLIDLIKNSCFCKSIFSNMKMRLAHRINIIAVLLGILTMSLSGCYQYQVRQDNQHNTISNIQVYKDIINRQGMYEQEKDRQDTRDMIRQGLYGY